MSENRSRLKIWKFHVFDIIVVLLILAVIFGITNKLTGGDVIRTVMNEKAVKVRVTLETNPYSEYTLQGISVGSPLVSAKMYLKAEITDVRLIPSMVEMVDNTGTLVYGEDPFEKKAVVTYEGTAIYKEPLYMLDNMELMPGSKVFLTTETLKLVSTILDVEIIE